MREQDTGVLSEDYFEKDHFAARTSEVDLDLDSYDNMIYACSKCNGNKSDKSTELLLNPCKDDIYLGVNPHVKNLGKDGDYQLFGNTAEGRQYIDALQLNSKFYREMRERQELDDQCNNELKKLINEIANLTDVPDDLMKKIKLLERNHFLFQTNNQQDSAFRCGHSRAGQAFQDVLDILEKQYVPYELLFSDKDIDIKIQYNGKEYLCEIMLNDKAEKPVKCIRMNREQRESWTVETGNYGVLYYYMKTGRLEFYSVGKDNELLVCFKEYKGR